jgi:polyisoprenoid-binding protein YceI
VNKEIDKNFQRSASAVVVLGLLARVGFSAHGSFKRSNFGMGFGVPAPGTRTGVGDLIDVSIEAEFTGPPLAAAPAGAH